MKQLRTLLSSWDALLVVLLLQALDELVDVDEQRLDLAEQHGVVAVTPVVVPPLVVPTRPSNRARYVPCRDNACHSHAGTEEFCFALPAATSTTCNVF